MLDEVKRLVSAGRTQGEQANELYVHAKLILIKFTSIGFYHTTSKERNSNEMVRDSER